VASRSRLRIQVRIPVRVRVTAGLAATAVVVVVSGCATEPSGGATQQVNTGSNQVQAYVQPLPPPGPAAYHEPREVVLAFLHASASYAFDPDAATQFLLPALRTTWHPGPVTVVSSSFALNRATAQDHSQLDASSVAGPLESVVLTGQRLATLSKTGQYQYSTGTSNYTFTLQKVNGVWLISTLPAGQDTLLLLQEDFEHVYQPRNLFFFARSPAPLNGDLVPDAVYAPLQNADSALNTNLASELVTGLLNDKDSWLSGATTTAFPRGTRLLAVTIRGQTAIVNLGGAAAGASPIQKLDMAEQLLATLSSTAYSTPLAHFVQLEIDGHIAENATLPSGLPNGILSSVTRQPRGPLVYQSGPYSISEGLRHSPVEGPWETGSAAISAIAADPADTSQTPPIAVAVKAGNGCEVYLRNMRNEQLTGPYHRFRLSITGGACTSLSWDGNGNVWAAAGRKIWVLALNSEQQWQVVPVALPAGLTPSGQPAPQILAVRIAPDGVRAALLIRSGGSNSLALATVTDDQDGSQDQVSLGRAVAAGTGLNDPKAMSWFSLYDLIVLDRFGVAEVPLSGGPAQFLGTAPAGAESIATDGVTIVVGTSSYQIRISGFMAAAPTAITWKQKPPAGANPTYQG
jgi:Lipoprotein LpqB beta-propeller domain/Sporulation and spore germination